MKRCGKSTHCEKCFARKRYFPRFPHSDFTLSCGMAVMLFFRAEQAALFQPLILLAQLLIASFCSSPAGTDPFFLAHLSYEHDLIFVMP